MLVEDLGAWQAAMKARAVPPDEAYRIALAVASATPAPAVVGYRIFWAREGACGCLDAPAEKGRQIIIGRHDHCDLVLDDEHAVSLRHVLVRVTALDDGFPVLHVLDLQTTSGFELSDGSKQRCVVGTGPIVFRIGRHSIVALPNGMKLDPEIPPPLVECADANPYSVRAERVELAPLPRGGARVTRITVIPSSVQLSELPSAPRRALAGEAAASSADRYELLITGGPKRAAIRLSAEDLERGVLLGRADKCVDAGLREVLTTTDQVSRVHALVIREESGVFLYDTGSSNGTFAEGARVRCVALSDEGTEVALAGRGGVKLRWRGLQPAS
jgi:pSer/pThr/pTyr-binding forkhead associated (FHA) protein